MSQLAKLVELLDREDVTEVVIATGRPVAVRSEGEYRPISRNPVSRGQLIAPGTRLLLGAGSPGAEAQFRIGPPFGQEVIVVVASAKPLFGSTLPETPTERDYLTTFRRSFAVAGAGGTVSAAVIPLRTEARR